MIPAKYAESRAVIGTGVHEGYPYLREKRYEKSIARKAPVSFPTRDAISS
jgi:hypothetical protein